ncbi:MAG: cytochrome b [Alphaproteobacteria bacterium]
MSSGNTPFKNPALKWVDNRLPLLREGHHFLMSYPTPKNLNYWWNFGFLALFCLVLMIISGIVLAMQYTPHTDLAFASVERIMRDVNFGWLLRYMHMNGASFFFIVTLIHIFRGMYYGSYKGPRELLWILGVVIYLLMMATAFLGYTLPWGQMSFWGAKVITSFFTAIPLVGEDVLTLLQGGFGIDNPTLNRFFVLHFLLPFVIFGVVILHILALHSYGSNNPLGIDMTGPKDSIAFHPYFTTEKVFTIGVFLFIFSIFIFYAPNSMGEAVNYVEANPVQTPAHIVPEWYFLPFYAILRAIPSKLGGVLFMFGSIAILFILPWLDTSKVRSAVFRPMFKWGFWGFIFTVYILSLSGAQNPDDTFRFALPILGWFWTGFSFEIPGFSVLFVARVFTFAYFAYFILWLPIIGFIEKTKPLPPSIAKAIEA